MRSKVLMMLVVTLGCSSTLEPPGTLAEAIVAYTDHPFVLKIGERATFQSEGLEIGFEAVTADSRCPSKSLILCVWEGDGAVLVRVEGGSTFSGLDTLHTTLDPKSLELGDYVLELQQLDPYPETYDPIPEGDYQATFVLRKR